MLAADPASASAVDPELASALRLSVMRLARRMRQQRSDSALSLTALSTLATLDRHGPLTPGELAAHEGVRPPSMTRVVAGLEEAGLTTRAPHPTDRRQVVVTLAPAGLALLQEDRRRREAWLAQRLATLPDDERDLVRRAATVLDRLASA